MGRSAIFCAALSAIEQCKTEVAIDIFHVVKGVRMQKPGAVVSVVSIITKIKEKGMTLLQCVCRGGGGGGGGGRGRGALITPNQATLLDKFML